jgi:hypothetical protein
MMYAMAYPPTLVWAQYQGWPTFGPAGRWAGPRWSYRRASRPTSPVVTCLLGGGAFGRLGSQPQSQTGGFGRFESRPVRQTQPLQHSQVDAEAVAVPSARVDRSAPGPG